MASQPIDLDQEEDSEEEEPEGAPAVSTTTRDLNVDEEMSSQGKASGSSKRKRVLKSKWWQYFEILPKIEGEDLRCKCKACGITYKAESSMGTGNLRRHILNQCLKQKTSDIAQALLEQGDKSLAISQALQSSDDFMRSMANRMFHKFDKYWKDYNILFAIAVIVDPRFKMQFVEFCYNKLYGHGSNELSLVRSKLVSLFEEYMHMGIASKVSTSSASSSSHSAIDDNASLALNLGSGCMDVLKEFDTFQSLEFIGRAQKSQLELYLEEPTIDRITKLDVLGFWKAHQFRYPDLAQMARDILSVPISTVASESAFSTGGRILDQYRSAMKPDVVEALVCCRDWLAGGKDGEWMVVVFQILEIALVLNFWIELEGIGVDKGVLPLLHVVLPLLHSPYA
ncbi:hypothetical protein ZIOFF_010114 [Zingiber officinale]|uniref:BED-type domain-containing protein n=1 Tax=Zingiber officinale TaxID=94328 RepID=A0A8J5HP12_ZINOF|nr:hypothetical protein ZIOFF_010114 [Zingiber officinale]